MRLTEHTKAISFDCNGALLTFNLSEINVQAKLGSAKRIIDLPNGGRLEAVDVSELEVANTFKSGTFWQGLHYLENHLAWVMVALVVTVFAGWLFLQFGVPKLAEYVAKATPPSVEAKLGEQALATLDSQIGYFSPSNTSAARKASINAALSGLCNKVKNCPSYRLEYRDGGMIGANAFALPGGIMVVTDQLITLAKNDTEIVAVLTHELGHVKQRHAFRQSLQGVLSGLILAAVTGDVSSVASGLPAVLMQMQYSRAHETEADGFALAALQSACLPPHAFADILTRLQNQGSDMNETNNKTGDKKPHKKAKTADTNNALSDILMTHPDTNERIKPFLQAKQSCQ